ncbi:MULTISPECIES: hypothetical protein [unclassified Streptomyces]|uniref:hypothetical protein n=1 Tax=unclassified Streptomyces TaxID=2593676 RepID=UPI003827FCDB
MGQQEMTGSHADGGAAVAGAATEFEQDVMDLLVETLRRAVRLELSAVGTDTLLGELVLGDTDAGEAMSPGMRKAGSLSGLIAGRAGLGWVNDDEVGGVPVAAGVDEGADQQADEEEVKSTAHWTATSRQRQNS